jgi:hypothetical protein
VKSLLDEAVKFHLLCQDFAEGQLGGHRRLGVRLIGVDVRRGISCGGEQKSITPMLAWRARMVLFLSSD